MVITQTSAFFMTLAIEVPLASVLATLRSVSWMRGFFAAIVASSLTHPVAWWITQRLGPDEYQAMLWVIEAIVCLVEALVFMRILRMRWGTSLALSVIVNAASAVTGAMPLISN